MGIFEWQKFNFFELRSGIDSGKVEVVLKDASISSAASGNNQIVICDSFGFIHIFTKNWEAKTLKGHNGSIGHCELVSQRNLLVTVGLDANGSAQLYKVWNISKGGEHINCIRQVKIDVEKVTALGVAENGQFMAIGFDTGKISLYRGDICRERTTKSLTTLSNVVSTITGIAFKQIGKSTQMFVCSTCFVLVYDLQKNETKITLDKQCKPSTCCVLQQTTPRNSEAHFMVGRDDAIYCYTVDGRGPCYALDGKKSIIQWFRSHLITITCPSTTAIAKSAQKDYMLTIIDVQNKFIVFSSPVEDIAAILIEFGSCFIITKDKKVLLLDEKDIQSKLNLLFKKNKYDIAVRIAAINQFDAEELSDIYKQYGDHLYSKGDFASSIEKYIKTIRYLEPSYIIRRFLDSRHINFLTDYLQELHNQGLASDDHTTLLLNCFTRLNQTDRLTEFLQNDQNPDICFDVDVAIKVCRSVCVTHALSLAKRNKKHELYVSMLIEDQQMFEEALNYIDANAEAEVSLKTYGPVLMEQSPDKTTELLKKIFLKYYEQSSVADADLSLDLISNERNIGNIINLFVNNSNRLIDFLEDLVKNLSISSNLIYETLLEQYLQRWQNDEHARQRIMDILKSTDVTYNRNQALILCNSYKFWPGIMIIYEEQQLHHLIVRFYLKQADYNNLLNSCKRLGTTNPQLWLQALTGLRCDKVAPAHVLPQILQVIAQEKLQSPLQILNCLGVENGPNLSSVREHFMQVFHKENELIKQEEEQVSQYRMDSNALKLHIANLNNSIIEFRGTLCNACHQPLTMPVIYFWCEHAYHQEHFTSNQTSAYSYNRLSIYDSLYKKPCSCRAPLCSCVRDYSESDKDCTVCQMKNMQLKDTLHVHTESREQHEAFHNALYRSTEPFSVVSEYFKRGLFNKLVIIDESDVISANLTASQSMVPSTTKAREIHSSTTKDFTVEKRQHPTKLSIKSTEMEKKPKILNPFDDDDDDEAAVEVAEKKPSYDDAKNPFADDNDNKEIDENSPFKEYDNNLNPFV